MRAAFRKAIESNRIFDPTPKELELLKDKAYVPKMDDDPKKVDKPKDKGPPKLKMILETHGIISEKIKPDEIEGILKNIRKSRTIKEACSSNLNSFERESYKRHYCNNIIHKKFISLYHI